MVRVRVRWIACLIVCVACWGPVAFAQSTATLLGTVTDESKGVLPGVTVTATELSSGRASVATTDDRGEYRLPSLPPGTYKVQAELSGFATIVVPSVELLVGQSITVPFTLTVAAMNETLTVTTDTPLITTQSAVVGGNIDRRQMQELPVLGRNWMEMSMLVKGITANTMAGNRAGAQRDDQVQLNLDGQQITQNISASDFFGQPALSREAIAEYALSTSMFDVTQGRSVGIQVQAISRSGTNQLRGAVYGNFRDDALVAKDAVARRVLPYSNQQAGFSIGGPIVENRFHYFGTYEYEREPNSVFVNPQVYAGAPVSSLTFPTKQTQHNTLLRTDYQASGRDRVTVRGTYWDYALPFGGLGAAVYPTNAGQTTRNNLGITGSWSRVLSDRAVQEVRIGYTRYDWATALGEGVEPTPTYRQQGLPDVGASNQYPQAFYQRMPSVRYDLSWHLGAHDLKIGGEFLFRKDGNDWPNNSRGIFTIEGVSGAEWARRFPLDAWNDSKRWDLSGLNAVAFNQAFANDFTAEIPRKTWALWMGDTWATTSRLTLNYGLRWDVDWGGMSPPGGIDTPIVIDNGFDPSGFDGGYRDGIRDLTNIAPRAGFTFKVTDALIVRGGGGLFYAFPDSILLTGMQQQVTNERRVVTANFFNRPARPDFLTNPTGGITREQILAGEVSLPPNLRNLDPDYKNPRTFQATAGFQQQIGAVLGIDADLLYNKGMHLGFDRDVNLDFDPASGFPLNPNFPSSNANPRPRPDWGQIRYYQSTLESEYLALATSFTRRLRNRWQAGGTYTVMFTNDDHGSNGFGYLAVLNNPFCQACEWGTSTAFQRHTLRLNGIYEAPWGITVAGIYSFGSGNRVATNYAHVGLSPILVATGNFSGNRLVTGAPFSIPRDVTFPDGSVHNVHDMLVDGTPTSYATGEQVPRNALQGRPITKLDLRLSKSLRIPATSLRVSGMFEVFNVFDTANYSAYNTAMNLPNFGRPIAAFSPRTIQLAFRAEF